MQKPACVCAWLADSAVLCDDDLHDNAGDCLSPVKEWRFFPCIDEACQ